MTIEALKLPESKSKTSITADYLNGTREVVVPPKRRKGSGKQLTVHNATAPQGT